MSDLPIHLAVADYPRIMPLALRDVTPDGIDLRLTRGQGGSWPMRADLLRRVLSGDEFDGGESSIGGHLRRVEAGDKSHVAFMIDVCHFAHQIVSGIDLSEKSILAPLRG